MNTSSGGPIFAFCGTRGLPAKYGGFETAVDEVTKRLVAKGYDCEVFCRLTNGVPVESYGGRRLVYVKGSASSKFDTFLSSIQTGLYLWHHRHRYAYVFWFNNANLPGILMTLAAGIPMAVNTDGLEWRRRKWALPFKAYYFLSSFVISRLCKILISDSMAIKSYYEKYFFKKTTFIPYGNPLSEPVDEKRKQLILQRYGLEGNHYFLQITRFEPDNLPLEIAIAFRGSGLASKGFKMVLVGYREDNPYTRQIKSLAGTDGIEVMDAIYDPEVLSVLRSGCFCYVHGNSVGGTNPALLEAMAGCPRVMAIEGPFSREVLGEDGLFFDPRDIISGFRKAVFLSDQSMFLRDRVRQSYNWDAVAESYLRLAEGKSADYMGINE